jgi:hypothetical protein
LTTLLACGITKAILDKHLNRREIMYRISWARCDRQTKPAPLNDPIGKGEATVETVKEAESLLGLNWCQGVALPFNVEYDCWIFEDEYGEISVEVEPVEEEEHEEEKG